MLHFIIFGSSLYSYIVYDWKAKHKCIANNILKIVLFLIMYVQVCMYICARKYGFLLGPGESLRYPRNGVLVNLSSHIYIWEVNLFSLLDQ